ncbi:MAG: thioredoxin domain-containing protein, partial [Verrucomicrobia bacterium]
MQANLNAHHSAATAGPKSGHTNRLAREKSPYLLQHAHNPVDWYPWGPEAFARARAEDKPIFLSIGYATCHWCHVMERESFEDEAVAAFLNAHFVCIKVDREERPDVDHLYMSFVQATTGNGGWPLNVFLTPDLKPFFGGTYFPPEPLPGRPGFRQILEQVARLWEERRGDIDRSAEEIARQLGEFVQSASGTTGDLDPNWIDAAVRTLKAAYDPLNGGFGGAPKFPRPAAPALLLAHAVEHGDAEALAMVTHTCQRMAAGGMYDQIGGGFARYSVDERWLVPHFEKMLYDNAQLAELYLDTWLVTGEPRFEQVVRETLDYVLRDMTGPEGGFFSAEDADSEGHEGRFYCWTEAELKAALTPEEFAVVARHYGVTPQGNFLDHSHPNPLRGLNVLHLADTNLSPAETQLLRIARAKLLAARSQRVRPLCDDKVLTSWNGLMLGAMARAGRALNQPRYLEAARRCAAFLQTRLWDAAARRLHHRWREGERDQAELLVDYAFLIDGLLDLYESTLDPVWLDWAVDLAEVMRERFEDPQAGGFWQSAATGDLILRLKDDYDGAEPAGNSMAALGLLRLAAITGRKEFRESAERTLRFLAPRLSQAPATLPVAAQALAWLVHEPVRIVIAAPDPASAMPLVEAADRHYLPRRVIMGVQGPVDDFSRSLAAQAGADQPVAFVCTGNACLPPAATADELRER